MDKKLLVFSIFVSLFILGGISLAEAVAQGRAAVVSYNGRAGGNSSLQNVLGGSSATVVVNQSISGATLLNLSFSIWTNASGASSWQKATLAGISGNTTCTSNNCTLSAASAAAAGKRYRVTWTLPTSTTKSVFVILQFKNTSGTAINSSIYNARADVDLTSPTVTLAGWGNGTGNANNSFVALTNNFVFVNLNRFSYGGNRNRAGVGPNNTWIAKVSDAHVRNCTLWTDLTNNSKGTVISRAKGGTNLISAGAAGFLNDSTAGRVRFWNATPILSGKAVPNNKYTWGVSCYDNATTPNYGVASTNWTFYFDNTSPKMAATNPLTFEDSDPNAKDTSTSGLFRIGGVWTSELLETLTFTCDVTEANLVNVKFLIKRPGSTVFDLEKLSTKKTLEFTDTSKTGIYEIKCITTDIAGNATTSTTAKFRLQSEDEGEVPGTPAYVKPFNVDFSKTDSKNIVEPAGRILTVTFDGKTEHTVNFQKVTATSVTLIITSTPKTLNLNVGDTKNVDVNDDGVDDFAVSLIGIIEGKANVNFKKLSGAAAVAREESGGTATTVSGGTGPATSGRSTTGIWIVVLIVVVGVIIYLVVARRKKK